MILHLKRKRPCQDNKSKIDTVVMNTIKQQPLDIITSDDSDNDCDPQNLLDLLNKILKKKSYKVIADELNIAIGTVKRWNELKNVPPSYCFELMRLANIPIDYSKYSFKEKDQFFTPTNYSEILFR